MDDGRFYTATAETKLQHAELFRASVGVPRILLWRLSRIFFAAYNAGPGRIASMRKEAAKVNLDPDNKWFNNVKVVMAEKVGIETTTYVRNTFKYYTASELMLELEETQRRRVRWLSGSAEKAAKAKGETVEDTGLLTGSAQIKCDRREPNDRE